MLRNLIRYIRKNSIPIAVTIICAYAFYLRMVSLYQHSFWTDELIQLGELKGTFWRLLASRPKAEFTSFLCGDYYLMFPFFKIFSYNKWGLAIPHIIATLIGFYLLYLICKRYFKTIWGYLVTFSIVCFNATLVFHATEIRTYAVLPTLALGTLYLLLRMSDSDFQLSRLKKMGAVTFLVMVIWFQVYGILMVFSSYLFVALIKYKAAGLKTWFKNSLKFCGLVLGIAMPLWLFSVFGPHHNPAPYTANSSGTFEYIPSPLENLVGFLKGVFCNLIGYRKLYFLFSGIVIPFIFRYKEKVEQILFLFIIVIMPTGMILISDLATHYWFMQRQFIWVIPMFAFFLGWSWDSFFVLISNRKAR